MLQMPEVVEFAGHHKDAVFVSLSVIGIFVALTVMGAVYRTSSRSLEGPVEIGYDKSNDPILFVSPDHLDRTHNGKAPYVEFRTTEKGKPIIRKRSMMIQRMERNGPYIWAPDKNRTGSEGGRVCVDLITLSLLREAMKPASSDKLDQPLFIRVKYPLLGNVVYLFKDHPDLAVRASAWVFLLTSVFAVFQTILLHALNY